MSLSREELLRELELLPVWQSRNPAQPPVAAVMPKSDARADAVETGAVPETQAEQSKVVAPPLHQFRLVVSEDAQWAIVLDKQHSAESEVLLQNMLKAVDVNIAQDVADATTDHLKQYVTKVIVVMGELEAQTLLNETQALSQMRGKMHQYQNIPVIATYSPSELLLNLDNKAKAWEDLCLAKLTIVNL